MADVRTVSLNLADMRQRMKEVREERKRLSTQFAGDQTGLRNDDQPETSEDVKIGGIPDWKEKLKQDPYVGEATSIIVDMQR